MINKIRTQLVQNAASILRSPLHLLPQTVQKKALLEGLKTIFHEALEDGDFDFLEGKWLKVSIRDLNLSWYISYEMQRLVVADKAQQEDVSFSGNLNDLVLIAGRKEDPDTLFFQRRLSIEGDTELGLEVKNLMDSVDLDLLPKSLQMLINQLADFVYKGVQSSVTQNEVINAYSN
ncbi:ubiquinone anaerobic biosynthesis accessory factor UbiT [Vibrio aestuarianus]|uniref:Ubiquinone biosynthesis accessory factor UbiT n=1 Tax=Vibrio aestuarianus TaxID=28171 RepID=A0ABM9FSM3_9VIBR|nr:SCP2 domain-containing protein [Vibrio aestuarianus]MDE1212137.1 SCP2 domain-containing protein [Vibrio aestuarianus]MDE1217702.1 SCP2 domain-containing protein [Vibrio aestuarianus]MDE1226235.1 SCP2 domain-containing protein [Vibrio aestuarianus]MDE1257440.1 SCP2 domain-containing protein [Vibrio aestuarianus]MDE1259263.1 SCP2 domain-containing protein [Vibrio aestuarianus]